MVGESKKYCLLTAEAHDRLQLAIQETLMEEAGNYSEIARLASLDNDSVTKILDRKTVSYSTLKKMMEGFGLELTENSYTKQVPPKSPSVAQARSKVYLPNPFMQTLPIADPDAFVGREVWLSEVIQMLNQGCSCNLVGPSRIGRSSILKQICVVGRSRIKRSIGTFVYLNLREVENSQDFFGALCHELGIDSEKRGHALSRALKGTQHVVCLDDIEQWTDGRRFDRSERRQLRGLIDAGLLIVLISSKTCLSELFPDHSGDDSPLYGICRRMDIPKFTKRDVESWINWHLPLESNPFTSQQIEKLWEDSGGIPGILQQSAGMLYEAIVARKI